MDHRWLYQLISELSNAPLQVEVQEVRVNPLGGQNRMSSASGRLYSFAGKRGGTVSMPSTAGRNADVRMFDRRQNIVPVIIKGTV